MKAKDQRIAELRTTIDEVSPAQALQMQAQGAALIDVRETDEIAQGSPPGAHRLGRGFLEVRIEDSVADLDRHVVTMCNSGVRSLFAAEELKRLGYRNIHSMSGGFSRWKNEGLPFETPRRLDPHARERYARHLTMPEVGEAGQMKLADAKVLLIGAGGLGCPAAVYLAAAGVGTIGIVDHDTVDRSNLQRQILHTDARIGMPKVASARQSLEALNPSVKVQGFETRLDSGNVEEIFSGFDIIVDGSDNFPTRYLVNDACVKLGKPNVHGAVFRFDGQATVFWPAWSKLRGPCYRCLYPEPPPPDMAPSCAEAGVLGVLPGVIGLLEAVETIKLLLGIGDPLVGRLLVYDALKARFSELVLERDPSCPYCGDAAQPIRYVDYEHFCAQAAA
ncbi:molybdopterin-synthase adenylyltransferase MoeB [Noviherbaspirillum cavernae]|uniref:Molybdopterin-synthase adenylyltransferase n=1 Tax=Noviherbaspirillum cavernae TaxID=2320862 RepID=A0A418X2G0_9BURK|nr:molybdopterin-synthase adenylyltransferase MoeB [Noviherbaspirillum cavernae]RJG06652.1 molybdopterin-synthase adenylyltransferase MoeB [Noviherbaspirillum cavernae]